MKRTDVFLTGGGLKGAYQYGFFKRLYEIYPSAPIDRVFGVSVGAINAPAVILRRMDILDNHWQSESGSHPFDTIMNSWCSRFPHPSRYTLLGHAHQMLMERSLFRSLCHHHFEDLWRNGLSDVERNMLSSKMGAVAYDSCFGDTVLLEGFRSAETFSASFVASTNHPVLFPLRGPLLDGIFADYSVILAHIKRTARPLGTTDLLVLNLHTSDTSLGPHVNTPGTYIYTPDWTRLRGGGRLLSMCATRFDVDCMVTMGGEDADTFLEGRAQN